MNEPEAAEINSKENKDKMNDFLFNMLIQDKYLQSIFITDMEGNVIYNKSNGGAYRDTNYFKPYIQNMKTDFQLIGVHQQTYVSRARKTVFSYIRVIKEVNTNTPIGYTILEISASVPEEMLNNILDINNVYVTIQLSDGADIFNNIPEAEREKLENERKEKRNIRDIAINGEKYVLSCSEKSKNGIYVSIYQDENSLLKKMKHVSEVETGCILLISFCVLAATIMVSGRLTTPLERLRNAMKEVGKGDFEVQVQDTGRDEVAELTLNFNKMVQKIHTLIITQYQLELHEREAQIKALQNQINPHFLYNTLETIAMTAELNDDVDVADMVINLGSFMRYSLTAGHDMSDLRQELECVKNYIEIQNVRYGGKIELQICCDRRYEDCAMMKMSLQPLVENALLHGYHCANGILWIGIFVERENEELKIVTEDRGSGIDGEKMKTVLENLDHKEEIYPAKESIGLRNVHRRLKLKYGDTYGLELESTPGCGTKVVMRIPIRSEEENASDYDCR